MAQHNCTTPTGLNDLQRLLAELEKQEPDTQLIKTLTNRYQIPYKTDVGEQINELLIFLNGLSIPTDLDSSL